LGTEAAMDSGELAEGVVLKTGCLEVKGLAITGVAEEPAGLRVAGTGLETGSEATLNGAAAGIGADFEAGRPERKFPGWREYQNPPATKSRVAAMPISRPFFGPEEVEVVSEEVSPSNWPPKTAVCGLRGASSTGSSSEASENSKLVDVDASSAGVSETWLASVFAD